mgnify:CR=1 FL=1
MSRENWVKLKSNIRRAVGTAVYDRPPAIISLTIITAILIGSILLCLPAATESGVATPFIDSLFTATSATCITGLVIYDTAPYWSTFGELVILFLIQLGGLGFVTLATFFLTMAGRKAGLKNMKLAQESLNTINMQDAIPLIKQMLGLVFIVELAGACLLSIDFVPRFGLIGLYYGVFHSVAAFCNAGFDLMGGGYASMADFTGNPLVLYTLSLLVIIGGLGFIVWQDLFNYHKNRKLTAHTRIVLILSAVLLILSALFVFLMERDHALAGLSLGKKLNASLFLSVNARSGGFSTFNVDTLHGVTKVFIALMMFIGGASGSLAGGIKVNTLGILLCAVYCLIRGRDETIVFNRKIPQRIVMKAFAIVFFATLIVLGVTILIHIIQPEISLLNTFFDSVSALGIVGLSTGAVQDMNALNKILVILCMFTGRIGPISFALALASGKKPSDHTIYPDGKFVVG